MNDTTELPDAIRLPLHRLWADAGYLIGRARQETDPERFVTIIKSRCEEIEAAYRAALAAPAPAVALQSVELTRDVHGMCIVKVNGREAIRDNGDVISHFATLDWFAGGQE